MDNLTFTQKIIKPHTVDPLEGYTVVVVEKIGDAGEEFRFEIEAGQRLPRTRIDLFKWLRGRPANDYFAFAVTGDRELRTTFSADVTMDDQAHEFTLVISLAFGVAEPRLLVTRRNDDPLRKVRDEIAGAVRRELVQRDWSEICHEFRGVEQVVVAKTIEPLRQFAALYGLHIHGVGLTARLPETYYAGIIEMEAVEHAKLRVRLQEELRRVQAEAMGQTAAFQDELAHKRAMKNKVAEGEIDALADTQEWERAQRRDAIAGYERQQRLYEAATDAGVTVLGNVARSVVTPAQLNEATRAFSNVMGQLQAPNAGSGAPMLGSGDAPALTAGQHTGIAVIAEMLGRTEQMRIARDAKKALQSAMLHLAAEVLVNGKSDDDAAAARYCSRAEQVSSEADLSYDDFEYVRRFLDVERLRNDLH